MIVTEYQSTIPLMTIPTINLFPSIFAVTFEDYFNDEKGFGIRYPTDWSVNENVDPGAVFFAPPPPNDLTTFVMISKTSLDFPDMTLEDLKNQFLEDTNTPYGSFAVTDMNDKDYFLGGYPAIRIEGIMDSGIIKQKIMSFITIKDSYYYAFWAFSDPSDFESYTPNFQGMLSSFWLK